MSRLRNYLRKAGLLACTLGLLSFNAQATDGSQTFRPTSNNSGIMTLYSSSFVDAGTFGFNLTYNLGVDTLEIGEEANGQGNDLENFLHSVNLGLGYKAAKFVHLFADLGLHYTAPLSDQADDLLDADDGSEFALGNVLLGAQFAVINSGHNGFGFGVVPYVLLPTAGENYFVDNYDQDDEAMFQWGFKLAFDYVNGHSDNLVVNIGYESEHGELKDDADKATWLTYGFGYQKACSDDENSNLFAEIFGRTNLDDPHVSDSDPIELIAGYKRYFNERNGSWHAGLGKGLNSYSAANSPDLRVFAGVNWSFGVTHDHDHHEVAKAEPVVPVVEEVVEQAEEVINKTIKVGKIYFATNSDKLAGNSSETLNKLVMDLNNNPGIKKVRVEGHTDSMGDANYNKQLSQKRAESVVNYLSNNGVRAERLEAQGFGEEQPIADNNTRDGRAKNRRVEFRITEIDDNINLEILQ